MTATPLYRILDTEGMASFTADTSHTGGYVQGRAPGLAFVWLGHEVVNRAV